MQKCLFGSHLCKCCCSMLGAERTVQRRGVLDIADGGGVHDVPHNEALDRCMTEDARISGFADVCSQAALWQVIIIERTPYEQAAKHKCGSRHRHEAGHSACGRRTLVLGDQCATALAEDALDVAARPSRLVAAAALSTGERHGRETAASHAMACSCMCTAAMPCPPTHGQCQMQKQVGGCVTG